MIKIFSKFCICLLCSLATNSAFAHKTEVQYLSGTDIEHTVEWEFFCSSGMNSGKWTTIRVPSQWEQEGFGAYNYGHDRTHSTEKGFYRHQFKVPTRWKGKRIYIVFEGSMTDTEVRINRQPAGSIHQGAFYRFKYDITSLLNFNDNNLLEVAVSKESSNASINQAERQADYWIFGGIFRPVYLEAQPLLFIDRVAINAKHDGSFYMDAYVQNTTNGKFCIEAQVLTLDNQKIGKPMIAVSTEEAGKYTVTGSISKPKQWTTEAPNLYKVLVSIKEGKKVIHTYEQKFGFRTIDFRYSDGFYVNDVKVKFKGVCRHTFRPDYGRASSKVLAIEDVNLIKDMNMNAVRMSHYPPDPYFLDVCDSLGLFVINELAGWQKRYDTPTAQRLVKSMVSRDVNHPSIVIWANGNEGGFNTEVRADYAEYDPQGRHVIEPWSKMDGIDTKHYPKYGYSEKALKQNDMVYMPTESLHGLHDGGHGAGLEDYWNLMLKYPLSAGCFLWNLADEGVVRHDLKDSIDVKGNYAPDGIVGPHHEKEGSFYTIKEVWSPVYISKPTFDASFNNALSVSNRYYFTNLNQCSFSFKLVRYQLPLSNESAQVYSKEVIAPDVLPGQNGILHLDLPADWNKYDVLYLTAVDSFSREIFTWSWNIAPPEKTVKQLVAGSKQDIKAQESNKLLRIICGDTEVTFNKTNGLIENICVHLKNISFNNGPRFTGVEAKFKELKHHRTPNGYVVEVEYDNNAAQHWTILDNGWVKLDYQYTLNGEYDYTGITFSYPDNKVKGAILKANGPYRVWKNRLKGVNFGIHKKIYNNTITGQTWDYPEFKGYYSNFYAVEFNTDETTFTVATTTAGIYLHLFTPERPAYYSSNVEPSFPNGDISFLNGISAIGTKFSRAEQEGPQGEKNKYNNKLINATLYFKFGD